LSLHYCARNHSCTQWRTPRYYAAVDGMEVLPAHDNGAVPEGFVEAARAPLHMFRLLVVDSGIFCEKVD